MRRMLKHIIVLFLGITPVFSMAQETEVSKIIESVIEGQLQNLDKGTDVGLIVEDLHQLAENPININSATETELSKLYVLNDIQIKNLLDYIKEYGPAYSIYELKTVDGFSRDILSQIQPFIRFGPVAEEPRKMKNALKYGKH